MQEPFLLSGDNPPPKKRGRKPHGNIRVLVLLPPMLLAQLTEISRLRHRRAKVSRCHVVREALTDYVQRLRIT